MTNSSGKCYERTSVSDAKQYFVVWFRCGGQERFGAEWKPFFAQSIFALRYKAFGEEQDNFVNMERRHFNAFVTAHASGLLHRKIKTIGQHAQLADDFIQATVAYNKLEDKLAAQDKPIKTAKYKRNVFSANFTPLDALLIWNNYRTLYPMLFEFQVRHKQFVRQSPDAITYRISSDMLDWKFRYMMLKHELSTNELNECEYWTEVTLLTRFSEKVEELYAGFSGIVLNHHTDGSLVVRGFLSDTTAYISLNTWVRKANTTTVNLRDSLHCGFHQVAHAIIQIHEHGFTHRTISPTSIFITETGRFLLGSISSVYPQQLSIEMNQDTGNRAGSSHLMHRQPHRRQTNEICVHFDFYSYGKTIIKVDEYLKKKGNEVIDAKVLQLAQQLTGEDFLSISEYTKLIKNAFE